MSQECGCTVTFSNETGAVTGIGVQLKAYAILRCPLHASALKLLEALKVGREVMAGEGYKASENALMRQVEEAIASAEKEKE